MTDERPYHCTYQLRFPRVCCFKQIPALPTIVTTLPLPVCGSGCMCVGDHVSNRMSAIVRCDLVCLCEKSAPCNRGGLYSYECVCLGGVQSLGWGAQNKIITMFVFDVELY